ncbi:glycosyltransferase [Novosphingobium kaempferiae]|uniref:glycosyltransferase n=1 Tax=Novosphingobium kaempferiae TaxID=2896849 RepID=UPI001E31B11F|nr:glycosyltransferase [Novosphingobium kaempferiae]
MIEADGDMNGALPLAGLKIGQLTASASRLGGGVSEAVLKQADMIRRLGGEPVIFALDDAHAIEDAARFSPSAVHLSRIAGPRQIGFAPGMVEALEKAHLDILHLHGIWMYPSRAGALWARRTGKPYLISPHGMLDPWITARGRTKKALARIGYEQASWRAATALHALTPREADDIHRETARTDSLVIPNAGPAPSPLPTAPRDGSFLYLGRIHPKKNIDALIDAWSARADAMAAKGARLTIAGWGEDAHVAQLRTRLDAAPGTIEFVGPLYGEAKQRAYAEASFFALPSHSEGLPMVVLEAWAAGTPVLMTTECNLPEGFSAGAALDCGFDADSIGATLDAALSLPHDRWLAMANAALDLAGGQFSDTVVAERWAQAYRGMVDRNRAGMKAA